MEKKSCFLVLEKDETEWGRYHGVTDYKMVEGGCEHPLCQKLRELIAKWNNLVSSHMSHIRCGCEREFEELSKQIKETELLIKSQEEWDIDKDLMEVDRESAFQERIPLSYRKGERIAELKSRIALRNRQIRDLRRQLRK